jgi:hypothetical protein
MQGAMQGAEVIDADAGAGAEELERLLEIHGGAMQDIHGAMLGAEVIDADAGAGAGAEELERLKEEHVEVELSKLQDRLIVLDGRLRVGREVYQDQKQERLGALEKLEYLEKLSRREEIDEKDEVLRVRFERIIVAKIRYSEEPVKGRPAPSLLKKKK